jgi:hypothetical protein
MRAYRCCLRKSERPRVGRHRNDVGNPIDAFDGNRRQGPLSRCPPLSKIAEHSCVIASMIAWTPSRRARRSAGMLSRIAARLAEKNPDQPVAARPCIPTRQCIFAGRIKILRPPDLRQRVQPNPGRLARPSCPPQTLSPRPRGTAGTNGRDSALELSPASNLCTAESLHSRLKTRWRLLDIVPPRELSLVFVSHSRGALHDRNVVNN